MSRSRVAPSSGALDVPTESFFEHEDGSEQLITQEDFEKIVRSDLSKEPSIFRLEECDWLDRPFSCYAIYKNIRKDSYRYFVVEPWLDERLEELLEMLREKVISDIEIRGFDTDLSKEERSRAIRNETEAYLQRSNRLQADTDEGWLDRISGVFERRSQQGTVTTTDARKLEYYLIRDFIYKDAIEPLSNDGSVEDIHGNPPKRSGGATNGVGDEDNGVCRVFIDHGEYEQSLPTNITFDQDDGELEAFVTHLAEKADKGISKRNPECEGTLPDGSRLKISLRELNEGGEAFNIRQFKDVPHTPIDLINWGTFSVEQMAYLWLLIEHKKNGIFAGETSTGKTTTLNACSLFMPSGDKIVSVEDTPELELPQVNWTAHTTREPFNNDESSGYSMWQLIVGALRMNPVYLPVGEIRGGEKTGRDSAKEANALFQAINTGHCTYTTFHADSPQSLTNRFTSKPIDISGTLFSELDFMVFLDKYKINGRNVRKLDAITEIEEPEEDSSEINSTTVHEYVPDEGRFRRRNRSNLLDEIKKENGWSEADLKHELQARQYVLAYLAYYELNSYFTVVTVLQGYMNRPEKILSYIARGELHEHIESLGDQVELNISRGEDIPRPGNDRVEDYLEGVLSKYASLIDEFRDLDPNYQERMVEMLPDVAGAPNQEAAGDAGTRDQETVGGASAPDRAAAAATDSSPQNATATEAAHDAGVAGDEDAGGPAIEGEAQDGDRDERSAVERTAEIGGQQYIPRLPGGDDGSSGPEVHLGVLSGTYTIKDGMIKEQVEQAREELRDFYDVDDDESETLTDAVDDEATSDEILEAVETAESTPSPQPTEPSSGSDDSIEGDEDDVLDLLESEEFEALEESDGGNGFPEDGGSDDRQDEPGADAR